jgi:hypothetical protein
MDWALICLILSTLFACSVANKTALSWNTNSAEKLRDVPSALRLLRSADCVFLQETLHTSLDQCILLEGFVGHHVLATHTQGRPSQGLSSFFRIDAFTEGCISRLTVVPDWLLVSRWARPLLPGVLFVNVYVPLHSGVTNADLDLLRETLRDLENAFPGNRL